MWTPEPLFDGETVFLLAGGPSLIGFDVERLRGRRVVAINSSAALCPWADVLYFQDHSWFLAHRREVEAWAGICVTASRHTKVEIPDKVRRISLINRPGFSKRERDLRFGRSSGHTAIVLAIAMGARRIVLLGYDMRLVDGRSHFHDDHREESLKLYRDDFLIYFKGWDRDAMALGVDVVNCTPGSALTEFRTAELDDILSEPAHG